MKKKERERPFETCAFYAVVEVLLIGRCIIVWETAKVPLKKKDLDTFKGISLFG